MACALVVWPWPVVLHLHISLCECAVANAYLSVRPSVRHTRDPRLNGSTYWNAFCTARWRDVRCTLS